jgi:nucleoside-diphosphate-sugar epimerase
VRVLVTGANGFVGKHLCRFLLENGFSVAGAVRTESGLDHLPDGVTGVIVGEVGSNTEWGAALTGVDSVVHLAARVHIIKERSQDPLAAFREVNVEGTRCLVEKAAACGVSRFVFLSSVGVNGEETEEPFSEEDPPNPHDPYSQSKWEAEQDLVERVSRAGELKVVVLRPPLVYGPNGVGNLVRLLAWVDRGIPLPLASVRNRRSFVYVGNLVHAIGHCLEHPSAANQTFLVSDGEDVSTPELIRELGQALNRPVRLFPVSPTILKVAGLATGRSKDIQRLVGSLTMSTEKVSRLTGWNPPFGWKDGIRETARWYSSSRS